MKLPHSNPLRLLLGIFAVTLLFGTVSVAQAGGRWTGFDPEINVGGHQVNIEIAVPPGAW